MLKKPYKWLKYNKTEKSSKCSDYAGIKWTPEDRILNAVIWLVGEIEMGNFAIPCGKIS